MPNPPNITNITPPRVAIIDERTGAVSREWYRFFYNLFYATGGLNAGAIPPGRGGTGTTQVPTDGTLLIGNGTTGAYNATQLGVGPGIAKTEGPGSLLIENTGVLSFSGGTTGLTPATATTGDVTLDGILDVDNGGTGADNPTDARANLSAAVLGANDDITSMSALTGGIASPTYIDMGDGSAIALAAGRLWYTPANGAWNLGMGGGNITQQVGEEFFRYGKASAPISDTNLQLVYKTGVVGASGVITFAPTIAGLTDPDQIIGIATEPIRLNGFGRVTTMGVVRGINTTGSVYGEVWADNDDIWYNPVTGGLTKVKPVAPNIKLQVGTVINAGSGGSGSFNVHLGNSSALGGTDSNVQLGTLATTDLLQYNGTYWTNVSPATVIAGSSGAPVTKTADFTVAAGETWLINNKSGSTCTVTLPVAASNIGRVLHFQNYQAYTVVSASSNVIPVAGGAASTAILNAVAGDSATLVSDGTNWVMTQYNVNNALLVE